MRDYEKNSKGHKWIEENGEVDIFAFERGEYHNGPRCKVCGYGFCHHCQKLPSISCKENQKKGGKK